MLPTHTKSEPHKDELAVAVTIPENYVSGGFAMEFEVPWMTPGAVDKLDELIRPGDRGDCPGYPRRPRRRTTPGGGEG
jgi:hypothetical protein